MPVLHPPESDSVMDVDVAPTSSNHASILNKHNGIEDSNSHIPNSGVKDSDSNKQNGTADSMSTFQSISVPQPSQFDGIFRNCKTLVLIKEREDDNLRKIVDASAEIKSIWDKTEAVKKRMRNVIDAKGFMFTTPLNCIKVHPQFQKFTALFCNGVANGISAPSAVDGLEVVKVLSRTKANLPPAGHIKRKDLQPGEEVYVMKTNSVDVFVEGTVLLVRDTDPEKLYKVRFDETKSIPPKLYTAKQLAYKETPTVIVPVGTRIIARYSDGIKPSLYAGIVAEPPKLTNHERYLIFFDDGYAQYIEHKDIYVACAQSIDVADDVHENISEFIRAYLQKYPERPMVKLQKDQITKTEYDRKWWDTKVLDVDASMVKMYFIASHRTEWIYRGSTRLKLLYNELANAEASRIAGKHRRHNIVPRRPNHPYVEYTRELRDPSTGDVETIELDSDSADESISKPAGHQHPRRKTGGSQYLNNAEKPRNTARKSTTFKPWTTENSIGVVEKYHTPDIKSHLGYKDLHNLVTFKRVNFGVHKCGPQCHEKEDPIRFKGKNPFLIPVYLGWERQVRRYHKSGLKTQIMYRTPCGRHLRDIQEIQDYLFSVKSRLTIDFFSMDTYVVIFRTFRPREVLYEVPDVTQGKENVPVCCVNSWDTKPPPFVEYAAKRFPGQGVFLNEDKEFLCGCSCTDNCQDPAKCECQQITNYAYSGRKVGDVGYKFRRLKEPVVTGIFECNDRCKCGPQCGNRVVQNGLQVRLQMFKTQSKGWGIRCLDDLDAGMFICIYAGQLLTEQGADEDGNQFGDEYLAELDHIEVAEKCKEGYETDVFIEDMEVEESKEEKRENDDDYDDKSEVSSVNTSDSEVNICETDSDFESSIRSTAVPSYATRSRRKSHIKISDNSSNASVSSFGTNEDSNNTNNKKLINKELPDITSTLDSFTLVPRPLSPGSAEIVEKTELKRIPKLSEDGVKSVAKKSLSMKHPGAVPAFPVVRQKGGYRSIRSYYGEDSLYIMDAKSKGNIGRYLNHSCSPNVFVQNVFVETHDLRFPEVAFFAQNFIQAGTELTWDYNYEVGSVADKVMYCYCDARTCRGRLL